MGLPRILRRNFQKQSKGKHEQVQNIINRLLWKIVANQGGKITIQCSELDDLPEGAAMKADYDPKTHTMTLAAAVHKPSGLITPDTGIITG